MLLPMDQGKVAERPRREEGAFAAFGRRSLVSAIFALCTSPAVALAQPAPFGPAFQVNAYTTSTQLRPAVAVAADGGFLVVWHDSSQRDGDGEGIFARRFTSGGGAVGDEFQVNGYTLDIQSFPRAARAEGGGFVVVWVSREGDGSSYAIFGRRLSGDGARLGEEFLVNSYTDGSQGENGDLDAAALPDGEVVAVWKSGRQDGGGTGVFGRAFDREANPLGSEFQISVATAGDQANPHVAADADGNFVVAWTSQAGDFYEVLVRSFERGGAPRSNEVQVNEFPLVEGVENLSVARAADGGFVVVWGRYDSYEPSRNGILARRFLDDATPTGGELTVNTTPQPYDVFGLASAADPRGGFLIVWSGDDDNFERRLFARRLSTDATPVGAEFLVDPGRAEQEDPAIAASAAPGLVVSWSGLSDGDGFGIFARRLLSPSERCPGDCDADRQIPVAELVTATRIALGLLPIDQCVALDFEHDGQIGIVDLIAAVRYAIAGCPVFGSGGVPFAGARWFAGEPGLNCDQVCAGEGLVYDEATRTIAGSDGSEANCAAILDLLGWPGEFGGSTACDDFRSGVGCAALTFDFVAGRCTSPPTTSRASETDIGRVCACR